MLVLFWHSVAIVAADDYDAVIASFRFLSLGEFVMAWKVYLPTGTIEVGSADLKRMAADGTIKKSTEIESTTNKIRTTASGIAGLVFKSEDVNLLDLPIPEVPQTPPTWNPPEDRREAFQEAPWTPRKPESTSPHKSSFLDHRFDFLITPSLLSTIWILWLIGAAFSVVGAVFVANAQSGGDRSAIVGSLLGGITGFIFGTIAVRVILETIIVIFKICEYLKNINDRG